MSKEINHENGQSKMIDGVNKVVNAVKVTLGPKGRCVAIQLILKIQLKIWEHN